MADPQSAFYESRVLYADDSRMCFGFGRSGGGAQSLHFPIHPFIFIAQSVWSDCETKRDRPIPGRDFRASLRAQARSWKGGDLLKRFVAHSVIATGLYSKGKKGNWQKASVVLTLSTREEIGKWGLLQTSSNGTEREVEFFTRWNIFWKRTGHDQRAYRPVS
jgi:hypothetical protein